MSRLRTRADLTFSNHGMLLDMEVWRQKLGKSTSLKRLIALVLKEGIKSDHAASPGDLRSQDGAMVDQ